ncbi:MAG: tyrosine-type recombinase/integrase, partial [Acidobacteriota bacterium]
NHPEWWKGDHAIILTLERRAVEIFFGDDFKPPEPHVAIKGGADPADNFLSLRNLFSEVQYEAKELADERRLRAEREKEIADLKREKAELLHRAETLHREAGKHITVTVGEAIEEWKTSYRKTCSERTATDAFGSLETFVTFIGKEKPLVKVRPGDIDRWIEQYKGKRHKFNRHAKRDFETEPVSPGTKKKVRAYLSTFYSWAVRRYDMPENPIKKLGAVPGMARLAENIKAIRKYDDLVALLDGLKPFPYWRAWVAVAILAGPRWAEQAWLKIDDVYLDNGEIHITSRTSGRKVVGTKTGRERRIWIEQTILLDILSDHVGRRQAEKKKKGATATEASQWLFPSTVGDNPYKPRTKTPPGQWVGTVFLRAVEKVRTAAKASVAANGSGEFWDFGPDEWRHCFGTALGNSGYSSLEISSLMGNSEDVCRRHYVAPPSGKRWPLKWH